MDEDAQLKHYFFAIIVVAIVAIVGLVAFFFFIFNANNSGGAYYILSEEDMNSESKCMYNYYCKGSGEVILSDSLACLSHKNAVKVCNNVCGEGDSCSYYLETGYPD